MDRAYTPTPLAIRHFWRKVNKDTETGCWLWTGYKTKSGYGQFYHVSCHRIAWELINGPIPEGLWVMHICDNPACINPTHLFLGKNKENMADARRKGHKTGAARKKVGEQTRLCSPEKESKLFLLAHKLDIDPKQLVDQLVERAWNQLS